MPNKVRIYTDGACRGNPGPGGWGAVIFTPSFVDEIMGGEQNTTNNRMELLAVIEALQFVKGFKGLVDKKVDLYSDSAYVVNAVKQGWLKKWKHNNWRTVKGDEVKNKDLWLVLDNLITNNVNLIKIKGHAGHIYNERADELAKQGAGGVL